MKIVLHAALLLTLVPATARAQINAGEQKPESSLPFTMTEVATFNRPWRIAFLPDGRMVVTEKVGPVWLVTQQGEKTPIENVPAVLYQGQGGMLGVFVSPKYATDHSIYLTYAEPGDPGTSGLALARARLAFGEHTASLEGVQVLWRDMPKGRGGQFGAQIAFSPDNQYLFLTVGDRQRMTPAQDPNTAVGKILRLTLDGKPAPGNPMAGKTGAPTLPLINPPRDTEVAKTAPLVSTYTIEGPNLAPAETWSTGVRTPYGLAFAPDGRLWEVEHGPRGGDELNLIEPGKNYGWPLVSYATNYNGVPIPSPDTRPDLTKPVIYWTPIIAPGNLIFYNGAMFPQWKGSALMSGIATQTLSRITFDGKGGATPAERWSVGHRLRDVEVGPDGALWMLEDSPTGGLFRATPKVAESAPPAAAQSVVGKGQTGPVPNPVTLDTTGLFQAKFVSVGDDMFIGGQPTEKALRELKAKGVTTLVNLRMPEEMARVGFDEAALVKELGMKYVYIPMRGTPENPYGPKQLDTFAAAMAAADGKVLLHCTIAWRASHLWAAYLIRERKMPVDTVLSQVRMINLMDNMWMGSETQPLEGFLGRVVPEMGHPKR